MKTYFSGSRKFLARRSPKSTRPARHGRKLLAFELLESRDLLAFDIVLNILPGLAGNPDALAAFERAAQTWESHISDDITVTIDADLSNLGSPNIIGQTGSVVLQGGYDTIRNQLVADASNEADDAIVSLLPTAANATFLLPAGFSLDGNVVSTKASLKAAGFTGLDAQFGVSDAQMTFNSQFQFDFDNSDGVTANTMDFETVATHEIGHALGFISNVDTVDYYLALNFRTSVAPSTLDMFRFDNGTAYDPDDSAAFASMPRLLAPGGDAITDDITGAGFSPAENRMSTGAYNGDGYQASHFKDNLAIGVMDPTLSFGEVVPISDADLRALDLIGYEISLGPAQNLAPVANNDTVTIGKKAATAEGNVLANDIDPNGDAMHAVLASDPAEGGVVLNDDGSFVYTPGPSFSGTDTFTYFTTDLQDNSNLATVTITSKGGGGGSTGGGGHGGGGSGGGGGSTRGGGPKKMVAEVVGFSAAAGAGLESSFSVHTLPAGMEDGPQPEHPSPLPNAAQPLLSQSVNRLFSLFGADQRPASHSEDGFDTTVQAMAVVQQQATPSAGDLLEFDDHTSGEHADAIDRAMAEFDDTLTPSDAAELETSPDVTSALQR